MKARLGVLLGVFSAVQASAADFDMSEISALLGAHSGADLSFVREGLSAPPGVYEVEVLINGTSFGRRNYEFRAMNGDLQPVLSRSELLHLGMRESVLAGFTENDAALFPLSKAFADVKVQYSHHASSLHLVVPQALVHEAAADDDIAPEAMWDEGMTAAMLDYTLTAMRNRYREGSYSSANLNLSGRINLGAWQLHASGYGSYSHGDGITEHAFERQSAYLERDVRRIKGRLKAGEISTPATFLSSVPVLSVNLATNTEMFSYTDQSFMPIISGFARTYAQVLVRQHGNIVHTFNVPPGPWTFNKLPALMTDGDFECIVHEADGSETVQRYAYGQNPFLLRENQSRYDVTLGRYDHNGEEGDEPLLVQATYARGFAKSTTLYGGLVLAEHYQSLLAGAATVIPCAGPMSLDIQWARHHDGVDGDDSPVTSGLMRLRWSKYLPSRTRFSLSLEKAFSSNWVDLAGAMHRRSHTGASSIIDAADRLSATLHFSQEFGKRYSASVNARRTHSYGSTDQKSAYASISASYPWGTLSLSYSRSYEKDRGDEEWRPMSIWAVQAQIPLGRTSNTASFHFSHEKSRDGTVKRVPTATVYGTDIDHKLSWRLSRSTAKHDRKSSAQAVWSGDRVHLNASYSDMEHSDSWTFGASGNLLATAYGASASGDSAQTYILARVPGVSGAKLTRPTAVQTDVFGLAGISLVRPYIRNEVTLDPKTLPDGVMLLSPVSKTVVPTLGSVTYALFDVRVGRDALFKLPESMRANLPFGTQMVLLTAEGNDDLTGTGILDRDGAAFMSGMPSSGRVAITWLDKGVRLRQVFEFLIPEPGDDFNAKDYVYIPDVELRPMGDPEVVANSVSERAK